jgi:hypothetical protein
MKNNKLIHFTFKLNLGKEQAVKWPKASIRQVITVYEAVLSRFVYEQSTKKARGNGTVTLNLRRENL